MVYMRRNRTKSHPRALHADFELSTQDWDGPFRCSRIGCREEIILRPFQLWLWRSPTIMSKAATT